MNSDNMMIEALEARAKRRETRRAFLQGAGGAAVALTGASLLSACGGGNGRNRNDDSSNIPPPPPPPPPPPGPSAIGDPEILNFALNLEYLEAEFYSYAAFGTGLPDSIRTGVGVRGTTIPGRQVNFTDPIVAQYAVEIAQDEIAHVRFLRNALGAAAVASPDIDVGSQPNGAFTAAARAAGLVGATGTFDAYATDENFLLAAYIFEDVGVTGYKGAAPLLTSKPVLEQTAGILAAEAYHASLIRTVLFRKGLQTPSLRTSADAISNARDSLDGATDLDQGISPSQGVPPNNDASNIVPADADALAFSRTTGQVLNIIYLNRMAVTQGGFLPTGANGVIRMSAAS